MEEPKSRTELKKADDALEDNIATFVDLREQLAGERALADRLADSVEACERWVTSPCAVKAEANKALMVWKEARK